MSEHCSRMKYLKGSLGKENICVTKQSNKLAVTDSQKIVPRKRFFSADLNYGGTCNCDSNNDVAFNEIRSSARKPLFQIHHDHAGNDLGKGARFRERIVEYDTRRIEKLKKNSQDLKNKFERTDESVSLVKKQQPEANSVQDSPQNFKDSKAVLRNSVVSSNKPIIRSIIRVSKTNLPRLKISTAKSLVDLSQVNKPSTLPNRTCDTVKLNLAKLTPAKRNLAKKRSLSSSSIIKSNNLVDGSNRVNSRSRSCSNRPSAVPTTNRVISIGSTNEDVTNVQKKQIESNKRKKLGGSKDSYIAGSSAVFSCYSSKEPIAAGKVKDCQIREYTKVSFSSNHKVVSTSTEQKSNDHKEQPLTDAISEKVQEKLESELWKNTDFSAYLLYHGDYLVDLLTIEKEKENSSPQLSPEFIDEYINSEPRKIVVAFLIRLITHCRYPSFILYQAVKIFDVIIDRITIEGSDMHLAAVTALWIVLKKDGNFNKIPSAKSMLEIAQGVPCENVNILIEWERKILRILNFNITFSDPFSIFVFYVVNYDYDSDASSGTITRIYYCGGYIIDLTLLDAKFSYTTSNLLGLTTAQLVMSTILDDEAYLSSPRWQYWRSVITKGVHVPIRYFDDEINLLRATMISHILESAKKHTKEEVIRKRYSHNRYGNISEFFLNKIMQLPQAEYSMCM